MNNINSKFNKSSDIFNINPIEEKPQIQQLKERNVNNKITYDFKDWTSNNNNNIQNQNSKTPIYSNSFKSSIFSNEPQKPIKQRNNNKSSLTFGNYDNSEFNVHKNLNNTISFNPYNNYKDKDASAYERKMKQLYNNNFNISNENNNTENYKFDSKKKSAYGTIEREKEKFNDPKKEFKNAKERKYNDLFNDRKELKYITSLSNQNIFKDNSTNTKFIEGKFSNRQNHINSLKSNIFNDPERENLNKQEIKVNKRENNENINNNNINNKYHGKKKILEQDTGTLPAHLDWKNDKTNLFNKEKPITTRENESAFIRKINDLYGENVVGNKLNNSNFENEDRKKIEIFIQNKYPNENESQIKKRLEYISDINNNNNINQINNNNIINKNYEIQFDKINNVNINEFKKVFTENGIHIYGVKEDTSYNDGTEKRGRITFSIRENLNKEDFDDKLNNIRNKIEKDNIRNKIEKEQGIQFIDYKDKDKRKKIGKYIPSLVKWDNNLSSHYKTEGNEKMTIIKGKNNLKKGEKITEINIDHNYKRSNKKK